VLSFPARIAARNKVQITAQAIAAPVLLVGRWHRMVLMLNAPRAVDFAKADGQTKLKPFGTEDR
jgi:hypothetical protein